MTIEKKNGTTTVTVADRLDTTTAPELVGLLPEALDGAKELVFDLTDLAYISSAGLCVLLKAQKAMSAQGSMKLLGVGKGIMEIFDVTGFTDIFTFE